MPIAYARSLTSSDQTQRTDWQQPEVTSLQPERQGGGPIAGQRVPSEPASAPETVLDRVPGQDCDTQQHAQREAGGLAIQACRVHGNYTNKRALRLRSARQ